MDEVVPVFPKWDFLGFSQSDVDKLTSKGENAVTGFLDSGLQMKTHNDS